MTATTKQWSYPWGGDKFMEDMRALGWQPVPSWGEDGWDLGNWPLVIVCHRQRGQWEVAHYIEGDVTVYAFDTDTERDAKTDELALFHWRANDEPWVEGVRRDDVPAHLRGPYAWGRVRVTAA